HLPLVPGGRPGTRDEVGLWPADRGCQRFPAPRALISLTFSVPQPPLQASDAQPDASQIASEPKQDAEVDEYDCGRTGTCVVSIPSEERHSKSVLDPQNDAD